MRQGTDLDEICALLGSGKNIVTTRGDFYHPSAMDPAIRARVEAACAKGNSSIYCTGSSPGFITEALAIPLLSLARQHTCLTIDEYADMTSRNSPEMIFNIMGFGVPMGAFDQGTIEFVKHEFAGSLGQLADAIGLPCEQFVARGELAAARHDKKIAAGLIPAGSVGATRITIEGLHQGKVVLRFRANWYCTDDIAEDWGLRESGWKVCTEGDTPLEVNITYPVSEDDYAMFTPGLTAHRPVNAIPIVCAAAPGIRTTFDMAQVIPKFST
jgi:4-hydroxy-tetrahydrodipicolinate reductase